MTSSTEYINANVDRCRLIRNTGIISTINVRSCKSTGAKPPFLRSESHVSARSSVYCSA